MSTSVSSTPAELAKRALPLMQPRGYRPQSVPTDLMDRYINVVKEVQVRIKTLNDIVGATRFFFADEIDYDEKAVAKFLRRDYVPDFLPDCSRSLSANLISP